MMEGVHTHIQNAAAICILIIFVVGLMKVKEDAQPASLARETEVNTTL